MKHKDGGSPYSMDANLLHISYEGRDLEDPSASPEENMWRWTTSLKSAPNNSEEITIEFKKGDPIGLNGKNLKPHEILHQLNQIGGKHGVGRLDLVENRYVGMKSRGCYETPGGAILLKAHRAIESLTLDREEAHLKDELMPKYASLIYNGFWWAPERLALQALIDTTQVKVNGWVKISLYKGNVTILGRDSNNSLFDSNIATFEDDRGAYDQKDAEGFIKINALRMRIAAKQIKK
jgi:argininosuccinate synthase